MDYQRLIQLAETQTRNNLNKKNPFANKNGSSAGPNPAAVAKFLAKKKADEIRQAQEEKIKKERLLALRNQNSKSAKAAKMMASKTKDNDFSKIILTDREIEEKNMIEDQIRRKHLNDPLQRTKERIEKEQEMEINSKGKRKRKSNCVSSSTEAYTNKSREPFGYSYQEVKKQKDELLKKSKDSSNQTKKSSAPKTNLSFDELIKMAEQKQKQTQSKTLQQELEEELAAKRRAKEEAERRERRLREEYYTERARQRYASKSSLSKDADYSSKLTFTEKPSSLAVNSSSTSGHLSKQTARSSSSSVQTNHYDVSKHQKTSSDARSSAQHRPLQSFAKSKTHSSSVEKEENRHSSKTSGKPEMNKKSSPQLNLIDLFSQSSDPQTLSSKISSLSKDQFKQLHQVLAKTLKSDPSDDSSKKSKSVSSNKVPEYVPTKINRSAHGHESELNRQHQPSFSKVSIKKESDLANDYKKKSSSNKRPLEYDPEKSSIEKKPKKPTRMLIDLDNCDPEELERIKKEIEQRKKAAAAEALQTKPSSSLSTNDRNGLESKSKAYLSNSIKSERNPLANAWKRSPSPQRPPIGRYLPPIGATYRRGNYSHMEEDYDDYEDEEDDDMNSFIDDGEDLEEQRNEVSSYIREIFGYDKRKYMFEDDDDIEESSFAQQMKEEARSAKIGLQEDLEDIRREEEELKRKSKKKKRRNVIDDSDDD